MDDAVPRARQRASVSGCTDVVGWASVKLGGARCAGDVVDDRRGVLAFVAETLLNGEKKIGVADGLLQEHAGPGFERAVAVGGAVATGDDNDRDRGEDVGGL
jgi:hypothetical protein